jgi:hypothetical protein
VRYQKPYLLKLQDRSLWVTAQGVATLHNTREYIAEFTTLVSGLVQQPWALVLDLRGWQPSPMEVFELLRQHSRWCFAQQLLHVEIIQPADPLLVWQYLKATEVERPDALVRNFAADETAARLSLQAAGFLTADMTDAALLPEVETVAMSQI